MKNHVEKFHLVFLQALGGKLDKSLFAVKGGCNLRFYFQSIRYSEDIDLDIVTVAKETLRKKIDHLLASTPFKLQLGPSLAITHVSAPKQSETTQRWKLELSTPEGPARTKIEFSRRADSLAGAKLEPVAGELTARYQLPPILAPHYAAEAACRQKIEALALRTETQARDIFDLDLLYPRAGQLHGVEAATLQKAQENAMSISFADFRGQVWAYLEPEYQADYDSAEVWNAMVERVCNRLAAIGGSRANQ